MPAQPAGDFDYNTHGQLRANAAAPTRTSPPWCTGQCGDAHTVLNVGAGAGSYRPVDRVVFAVEPSAAVRPSARRI